MVPAGEIALAPFDAWPMDGFSDIQEIAVTNRRMLSLGAANSTAPSGCDTSFSPIDVWRFFNILPSAVKLVTQFFVLFFETWRRASLFCTRCRFSAHKTAAGLVLPW